MQIRQLQYFTRIIESGSVSRASQSLHIAQPALSQQLNQLEAELGVQLLTRSVRGVTPTKAGLAVYRQATLILKQVEATRLIAAQAESGPAGTVTVGLPWSMITMVGLPLLREVAAKMSMVRLEIVEGPSSLLSNLLSDGRVELAVLFSDAAKAGLVLEPLAEESLLLIGPHGSLAGKDGITLEQAAAFPMILMSRPNPIRDMLERIWEVGGQQYRLSAEINSPLLLLHAVKAGLGYSIVPAAGLEQFVRNGEIDAVKLSGNGLSRTVYIGSSRLFARSAALDGVEAVLRGIMLTAAAEGRWHATLADAAPRTDDEATAAWPDRGVADARLPTHE